MCLQETLKHWKCFSRSVRTGPGDQSMRVVVACYTRPPTTEGARVSSVGGTFKCSGSLKRQQRVLGPCGPRSFLDPIPECFSDLH